MSRVRISLVVAMLLGSSTLAFAYASNPAVQDRQAAMQIFGSRLKMMAQMSRGEIDFDAAAVQTALSEMSMTADGVPALFKAHERDPESKASGAIWENWDDFVAKAGALKAVIDANTEIDSVAGLNQAMVDIGGACKSCHMAYQK